ncbi:MAG: DUF1275 domain-containing protein [Alphaproteobacteria bacterium]|nr:DUF1275 domain-containing protein [Alphaproteobacteria bacterium]
MVAWAALLAGIAGYIDAICFLQLGKVFAANMTGNLVHLGLDAAAAEWSGCGRDAAVILAYLFGVVPARLLLRAHRRPRQAFAVEAVLIAAASAAARSPLAAPVLAVAMAIQNEAAAHGGFVGLNVGFITGDLEKLGERFVAEMLPGRRRDPKPRLILVILAGYAAGAAAGSGATGLLPMPLLVPAALLLISASIPARWSWLRPAIPAVGEG